MKIDVCSTPALIPYYSVRDKVIVVVDVLRASSVICTGIAQGLEAIIPVSTVQEAQNLKSKGYLVAAERNGMTVEGFDMGNSPTEFLNKYLKDQTLALTTSNGTWALEESINQANPEICIGCFVNASPLLDHLKGQNKDILMLCAGRHGNFSMEDSLFSGYVIQALSDYFQMGSDSALAHKTLYESQSRQLANYIKQAAHPQRLMELGQKSDLDYCLKMDQVNLVPVLKDGHLIAKDSKA